MKRSKQTRQKRVWYIFRFKERFELPDTIRFGVIRPPRYVREYVGSGQEDEAINYKRQIAICEASPNRHKLISSFVKLRDIAANCSKAFRGYILDEKFGPPTRDKIAAWLGLNKKEADKILKELEQIGLIERVTLPDIELLLQQNKRKSRRRSSGNEGARARTRKSEKKRAPLKKEGKAGSGNGSKRKNLSGTDSSNSNLTFKESDINPKGTDGGVIIGRTPLSGSLTPRQSLRGGKPQRLGVILYTPHAQEFAETVCKAIGTPYVRDSKEWRSEIACWQQAWARVELSGIGLQYRRELWTRTIGEAQKLRQKVKSEGRRKFKKSPEAVLRHLFNKLLAAKIREAHEAGQDAIKVS